MCPNVWEQSLLAKAEFQSASMQLPHRHREQARSHNRAQS
ncbi:hypothetical protein PHLH4_51080 [Pseudomonas sp. St316]|nr:hypothetical protein PHLH4_51080 [Pseudomonas sp. St316]